VFLLADDLASNRLLSERMDRIAAKPYYQAKPECEAVDKQLTRGCTGLLTRLVLPALTQCCEAAAVADARRRAVRLALAVERYRAGHGRFPARLEDLVPEFIPLVPLDPFDGQPMRMRRTGQRLIVYSIGPDLTDDGGAPLDKTKKTGDIPFELIDAGP
jgi:hypothetical protein